MRNKQWDNGSDIQGFSGLREASGWKKGIGRAG